MKPGARPVLYGDRQRWGLVHGDAFDVLAQLPPNSVDAVVTDPPYGIDIAGEAWDGKTIRAATGRPISPGQAFEAWTRQWATACLRVLRPGGHLVAFGAPRTAHRLTSGIEDAGFEIRDHLMWLNAQGLPKSRRLPGGQGTALRPLYEPIVLARRPFTATVADNLQAFGTGALNIDAASLPRSGSAAEKRGMWPGNALLTHAPDCREGFCHPDCATWQLGPASRLFYAAKAPVSEREAGCEHLPLQTAGTYNGRRSRQARNIHPTVKPLGAMRWLTRLVTPPGGVVLDLFAGSGTGGAAAVLEDRQFIGIEKEARYVEIARARISHSAKQAR